MAKSILNKVLIVALPAILMLSNCSPRAGHSILTFFFDGVPDHDSVSSASGGTAKEMSDTLALTDEATAEKKTVQVLHYPYQEKECAVCHDQNSLGDMVEPEPGLCYQCHEDFSYNYKFLHGPVAGGYCTACHHPHMAAEPNLLRRSGQALCLYCHEQLPDSWNEVHGDLGDMNCTECHNPHGGEDKNILY